MEDATIACFIVSIGEDAFFGCKSLKKMTIPNSVCSIGNRAFGFCDNLKNVVFSDSVISIGKAIFVSGDDFFFTNRRGLLINVKEGSYAEKYCKQYYPNIELKYY